MTIAEQQASTIHFMFGAWKFQNDDLYIHIVIDENFHIVKLNYNGHQSQFGSGGHWWGDNHLFFDNAHFVRYADQNKMIFGKNLSAVVGVNNEWEHIFERIQ